MVSNGRKNKSVVSDVACFLSDEIGFSLSEALASSFIRWHLPLQCILGFALLTHSTLAMYS